MFVQELWRYPVKSMAGERLDGVEVGPLGFKGDRIVHVRSARQRVLTARTHHQLLGFQGTMSTDGQVFINGQAWNSPESLRLVRNAVGADVELAYYDGPERFDILPLLVATDGAIQAFGHDSRRLRPNIVVGGVEHLDERSWEGRLLRINNVLIGIQDLRDRCVMTTYDPGTLEQDMTVLKEIVARFDGKLALNCFVVHGGQIQVGDCVELLERAS